MENSAFECTSCNRTIEVQSALAGKTLHCPYCRSLNQVPNLAASSRPSPRESLAKSGFSVFGSSFGHWLRTGKLARVTTAAGICLIVVTAAFPVWRVPVGSGRRESVGRSFFFHQPTRYKSSEIDGRQMMLEWMIIAVIFGMILFSLKSLRKGGPDVKTDAGDKITSGRT